MLDTLMRKKSELCERKKTCSAPVRERGKKSSLENDLTESVETAMIVVQKKSSFDFLLERSATSLTMQA